VTVADGTLLNYEAATSHNIIVRATSADTSTSTQSFTINLTDVNESAVSAVSDSNAAANTILENSANGTAVGLTGLATDADGTDTVTYSLDDNAGGRFAINSTTGIVTVNGAIDREAAASYDITIRATSSDTSSAIQTFTINIGDVNEFDTSTITDSVPSANSVSENASIGTTVGITAQASDADATNNTISYSLDNNASGRFVIDSVTGMVTVAGAIDYESATSHLITVRSTSTDGSFATRNFTISVNDANDNAPVIAANQAFSVNENRPVGTSVGFASATDVDTVGALQNWQIVSDTSGGRFAINAISGQITTLAGFNFEQQSSFTLVLSVADGTNLSTNQTMGC